MSWAFAMHLELAAAFYQELQQNSLTVQSEWAIDGCQLSYIWCVQDAVAHSRSVEEFLAKSYSRHPYSALWVGKPLWEYQVNMSTWLSKLSVAPATQVDLQSAVSAALAVADEAENPDRGQAFRSLLCAVEVPAQGWSITEIDTPRNPVGATDIVVFQAGTDYFFLETHRES